MKTRLDRSRLASAIAALVVITSLPVASAASRRESAVDALGARMQAAEARYLRASAGIRSGDAAATREGDAALQDMEAIVDACVRTRGCPVGNMLTTYRRLLKADGSTANTDETGPVVSHTPLGGAVPEATRAAALLSPEHRFDRMVEYNPAVQEGIRRWLTDMRGSLLASYENYRYMQHLMAPSFERGGLPEALLFGILAKESNGKVHATSRAGAGGPLQFMPATGRRFGLGPDGTGFDTRYDPRAAAMASAEYLNERMGQLNRNIEMALAAYNGGEGRALRVHRETNGRSFWDESVYNQFPSETRDYVPMVIAAAWLFLHPEEHGLTFPKVETQPATLRLAQPASLYQLTICLGNRDVREGYLRTLRNLNPRHDADTMLSAGTALNATTQIVGLYNRWCTNGARANLARTLVMSDASRAIVRRGSSRPAEGMSNPDVPPVTAAIAPVSRAVVVPATTGAAAPATAVAAPVASSRPVEAPSAPQVRSYQVQEGDTLMAIARRFDCRVGELALANDVRGPQHAIRPGQLIRLEGCRG